MCELNKRRGTMIASVICFLTLIAGAVEGQTDGFRAGQLAVLRIGDGASDLRARQNPVFIDQFDREEANQSHPSFSAALPEKGTNAIWMNGNAGTEGGLFRSADGKVLTLTGYCGDILSKPGTPSKLPYDRGIGVVDASGMSYLAYRGDKWYGLFGDKTNPRGVVSDGTNNFWGCGNEVGTLYFSSPTGVVHLEGFTSTRAVRMIGHSLYASISGSDGNEDSPAGIYHFADASGAASDMPVAAKATMKLSVPSPAPFSHIVGFDMNERGDTAYMADTVYGILKFAKTAGQWHLACHFYIPGYGGADTGILTNSASTTVRAGCFALKGDFAGQHPVIFATTTEWSGYNGLNVNSNQLIRIDDTNAATGGVTVTNFGRTLAFAPATNICFRGLDFTPESRLRSLRHALSDSG